MLGFILFPLMQVDPHTTSWYLILGYGVMWLVGFIYVMWLWVEQRNMQRDIELMKRILSDLEESNDTESPNVK